MIKIKRWGWFVSLVLSLFFGMVCESIAQNPETSTPANWDIKKIRADGDRFLFESIPKSNFKRSVIEHAVTSKIFKLQLEDLSDKEIISLCDYRAVLRQMGEKIIECSRVIEGFKGAEVEDFPRADKGRLALNRILKLVPTAGMVGQRDPQESNKQVHWNVWMDPKDGQRLAFKPITVLEPEHDYLLAIDLSAFRYDQEINTVLTQEASSTVVDLMNDPSKMPDELELLLLHDKTFFTSPRESVKAFKICKENIKNRANIKQEHKPFTVRKQSEKECFPDFLFGHAILPITTQKGGQGPTSLGLSIWAKKRPVDEVSLQLCVATEPAACKGFFPAPKLSFKGIDSLRVGKENEFPDAALHFLVKDPKEGVIGVFRRNDKNSDGAFVSWPLDKISAHDLLEKFRTELIPALEDAAKDPKSTSDDLAKEAKTIYEALFPTTTTESKEARKAFEEFLKGYLEKDPLATDYDPPSLFVRMVQEGTDPPLPIPLGLLLVNGKFLGDYFRIESPLEIQNYEPGDTCITNWIIVAPSLFGPKDGALQNAFAQASDALSALREEVNDEVNFDSIDKPTQLKQFRPWIREDAPKMDRASALIVLSHHDSNTLYFDKDSDKSVLTDSVNREFGKPSVVILNGCGTGGGGARRLIRRFNEKGFATVIALSTQVGAELAGDYVGCLAAELQKNVDSKGNPKPEDKIVPISRVHYNVITKCLRDKPAGGSDTPKYGPRVLAYTVLGNGYLRLCPPKK